eukprot:scaffold655_cov379-Prasinococcus_capsulatus_cf.AAC.19
MELPGCRGQTVLDGPRGDPAGPRGAAGGVSGPSAAGLRWQRAGGSDRAPGGGGARRLDSG